MALALPIPLTQTPQFYLAHSLKLEINFIAQASKDSKSIIITDSFSTYSM